MRITKHCLAMALGISLVALCPLRDGSAASITGTVSGVIKDVHGVPLAGAAVTLLEGRFNPRVRSRVTTDGEGKFAIPNLIPGLYSLSVQVASYSPLMKTGISVLAGQIANLNLVLENLYQQALGRDSGSADSVHTKEDIESVLRTVSSTRPIMRVVESQPNEAPAIEVSLEADGNSIRKRDEFRGVVNFYTTAYSTDPDLLNVGGTFTEFALARDINARLGWLVAGVVSDAGFSEVDSMLRLRDTRGHNTSVRLSFGQLPYFDIAATESRRNARPLSLLNIDFQDELKISDFLSVSYGTEFQGTNPAINSRKFRPRFRIGIQPTPNNRLAFARTTSLPRMTRTLSLPEGENIVFSSPFQHEYGNQLNFGTSRVTHTEVMAERRLGTGSTFTMAAYSDEFGRNTSPFVSGRMLPFLPDSKGLRMAFQRPLGSRFDGTIGYTYGGGLQANQDTLVLAPLNVHVLTARVSSDFSLSQTQVVTTYRWTSEYSITVIDPYQEIFESSSPGISIMVTQLIPYFGRFIPGKLEAQLDVRSLLAKTNSNPFNSATLRRLEFSQPPKSVRGGINLKF
jgi:hypothetical protein